MGHQHQISHLQDHNDQQSAAYAALGDGGFRGSKADALMALEYDRIPNVLKTQRAIALQRKIATAVMIIVPILLVAVAVIGGINAYRDRQRSAELRQLDAALERDFQQKTVQRGISATQHRP